MLTRGSTIGAQRAPVAEHGAAARHTVAALRELQTGSEDHTIESNLTAMVRQAMPFTELLGVNDVVGSVEEVCARLAWHEFRCTSGGAMHGGALMGMADAIGGLVAFLNLPAGAVATTTIESKTNFLRGVTSGGVDAISRPLHRGRRTMVVDTTLHDDGGRLVARVTQTQAVLYPDP